MCQGLQEANGTLKSKLNGLEGPSWWHNMRIMGIKVDEEAGPTEFVSELIPELLGWDTFTKPGKIYQAHHSQRLKQQANERPRVLIALIAS